MPSTDGFDIVTASSVELVPSDKHSSRDRRLWGKNINTKNAVQVSMVLEFSPGPTPENFQATIDPRLLDWDGMDDKENPHNWSAFKKWYVTIVTALVCLCITFESSIYTDGVFELILKYNISRTLAISGVSFYVCGLALGPLLTAPLSELVGRKIVYLTTVPLYMLFTMSVGLSKDITSILVSRFFAGLFGGPTLAVAAGTVVDIWGNDQERLATAMAIFCVSPFLGPVIGPIASGYIVLYKDWKYTNWVLLMFSGIMLPFLSLCPETFKMAILKRRAKRRNVNLQVNEFTLHSFTAALRNNLFTPLKMLVSDPLVGTTSLYIAFIFAVLFGFFEAFPIIFRGVYQIANGPSELPFLAVGAGLLLGVAMYLVSVKIVFKKQRREARERDERITNGEPVEDIREPPAEMRLLPAVIGGFFLPIALFWLGWSSKASVHWIVPTLSGIPFGFGLMWVFFGIILYYAVAFPPHFVASALAANSLFRYTLASVFPLFVVQMYEKLQIRWATSVFAFIALAMLPIPLVFFKYGSKLRNRSRFGHSQSVEGPNRALLSTEAGTNSNETTVEILEVGSEEKKDDSVP